MLLNPYKKWTYSFKIKSCYYTFVEFKKIKLNLAMALLTVILSLGFFEQNMIFRKAFPDMSNIFEHVVFYNQDGELVNFKEHKDKVLLIFLDTRIVLMFALPQFCRYGSSLKRSW